MSTGSGGETAGSPEKKEYSWDKREAVNPDDYKIKGFKNEKVTRGNGAINGNQLLIEDCTGCDIYVLDHSAVVTIDDCIDCTVFIGPIKGSVFIRDSKNCKFIIACQQFRTRDCENIDVLLACNTLPIIESTQAIRFGCFRGGYFTLAGQFGAAGISVYNNYWYKIHDFTKSTDGDNYSFFHDCPQWTIDFYKDRPEDIKSIDINTDPSSAVVPVTSGPSGRAESSCLVVAFLPTKAKKFLQTMLRASELKTDVSVTIVRAAELTLTGPDAAQIFVGPESEILCKAADGKPVFGFEVSGAGYMALVHAAKTSLGDAPLFVSEDEAPLNAFFAHTESKLKI